jgi:hypothetical protein
MRQPLFAPILIAALAAAACAGGAVSAADEERIKGEVVAALREAYDITKPDAQQRMLSLYPATGRVISANTGRTTTTRDSIASAVGEFWRYVGVNMIQPRWEWGEMFVDVLSRDAAAVTATYRIPHHNPNHQPHVLGGAMTVVFKKQRDRWVIIQEHLSDTPQLSDSGAEPHVHPDTTRRPASSPPAR